MLPKETTPSVINSEECYWITSRAKVHGFVELASKHLKFVPVLEDDTNSETYNRWGKCHIQLCVLGHLCNQIIYAILKLLQVRVGWLTSGSWHR